MAVVGSAAMPKIRLVLISAAAGIAVWLAASRFTDAAERDLYSGLASLRAGAQTQAEEQLTRYRDGERDPEILRTLARVLPLLKRPLPEDVREYIAVTLEESVRPRPKMRVESSSRPSYWSRMFPVFP
jgi:hypothetical protein